MKITWQDVVLMVAVLTFLFGCFGLVETGRWPWERK